MEQVGFKANRRDHINTCVSSLFPGSNGFSAKLYPSHSSGCCEFVSLVCPGSEWSVAGTQRFLSQPDPSVELRAQLLEAHRELRGHCETQLATCRRTCHV